MKYDILGSCVTRDAFSNGEEVNKYYARSSIASIYSKPVIVSDIDLQSKFQSRSVTNDLTKNFRSYIKNFSADYLIIDLIDERFRILKNDSDSYLTRSTEFLKTELSTKKKFQMQEKTFDLWREKADLLISDLKKFVGEKNVIIHKAFWSSSYISKNLEIKFFETENYIAANKMLNLLYSYIEYNLPNASVIELNEYLIADESHKWGLSNFHYQPLYYAKFRENLTKLSNSYSPF